MYKYIDQANYLIKMNDKNIQRYGTATYGLEHRPASNQTPAVTPAKPLNNLNKAAGQREDQKRSLPTASPTCASRPGHRHLQSSPGNFREYRKMIAVTSGMACANP